MFAGLVSLRNMIMLAALALFALGGNIAQTWHLWKVEAAASAKYEALAETNKGNDKINVDLSQKLAACIGKSTASDKAAADAEHERDALALKLQNEQNKHREKLDKAYETDPCKQIMASGVCPAVSDLLRLRARP